MARIYITIWMLVASWHLNAQQSDNVYALIIGISDYQEHKDLQFADKDAKMFADYLQSEAGGAVPRENIELLTEDQATIANIYIAKSNIENQVKQGGTIYFYFSGHGDVESSLYELGFLLASDSPSKNYLSNAVRVEDINNMANSLAVLKNVQVILITDACHAGKLSGSDNRGQQLVGEQLTMTLNNEVRIASCDSTQLSYEGTEWGDGRGAFSYYLIKGLMGLADEQIEGESGNGDGKVTLRELKKYLENEVTTSVATKKLKKQTPVVKGDLETDLAFINDEEFEIFQQSDNFINPNNIETITESEQLLTPQNRYFDCLDSFDLKNDIDFSNWTSLTEDQIIDSVFFLFPCSNDSLLMNTDWYQNIETDSISRHKFAQQFAASLHNIAQQAVNGYLNDDQEIQEERQYYNIKSRNFRKYRYMLQVAEKLVDESNYLHEIITMKKHYFKGLDDRFGAQIKGNNSDSLLESALVAQEQAYQMDPKAAYVANELGIIHKFQDKYDVAINYYQEATNLIPSWAAPQSNLSNIYNLLGQHKLGLQFANKALRNKANFYSAHIHRGLNAQKSNNLLLAEESFHKAILVNDKHYRAFEELGQIYTNLSQFELANHFYAEAEERKNPSIYTYGRNTEMYTPPGFISYKQSRFVTEIDTNRITEVDQIALCNYGVLSLYQEDYKTAQQFLERVIRIDKSNPLVYRYLAEVHFRQQKWTNVINYCSLAKPAHLDTSKFKEHLLKLSDSQKYLDDDMKEMYQRLQYDEKELNYLKAEAAEKLGYFGIAEAEYRALIEFDKTQILPYLKLAASAEKQGNYNEVETILNQLKNLYRNNYNVELYAFYKRMIEKSINDNYFQLKAGILAYEIALTEGVTHKSEYKEPNEKSHYFPPIIREIETPGTKSIHIVSGNIQSPILKGIEHLKKVESAFDIQQQASIYNKLGLLYGYHGDDENSIIYHSKANKLDPENRSYKLDYLQKLYETYSFSDALSILDELNRNQSLLYNHMLTYARYLARVGRYVEAFKAFQELKKIDIVENSDIYYEETIALSLAGQLEEAIDRYNYINQQNPSNSEVHYSLARLYASNSREKKAFKSLEKAFELGFAHNYVIQNDPAFSEFRNSSKWRNLILEFDLEPLLFEEDDSHEIFDRN